MFISDAADIRNTRCIPVTCQRHVEAVAGHLHPQCNRPVQQCTSPPNPWTSPRMKRLRGSGAATRRRWETRSLTAPHRTVAPAIARTRVCGSVDCAPLRAERRQRAPKQPTGKDALVYTSPKQELAPHKVVTAQGTLPTPVEG